MNPVKFDSDGVPCFCSNDVNDYGLPSLYGFNIFRVIESRESDFVTDYKMEQSYDLRPIHRYSRVDRLKTIMAELTGERGGVPTEIIQVVKHFLGKKPHHPWNQTRSILKHFKKSVYYNRIPFILNKLGFGKGMTITHDTYRGIIRDFMHLHTKFEEIKGSLNRKYFPSMRYTVLRLLQLHGYHPNYDIPLVRTKRKHKSLEKIWKELVLLA